MTTRQTKVTFEGDAHDGPRARGLVIDRLAAWGLAGEQQALELIVSELFTNAVMHGRGPIEVCLSARDDAVRLEVHDRGGGRPVMRGPDPAGREPGGWGLRLVDKLADAWGTEVRDDRTVVWVERSTGARGRPERCGPTRTAS